MTALTEIYRPIINAMLEPVLLVQADETVLFGNEAVTSLLGGDVEGRPLPLVLRHPDILRAFRTAAAGAEESTADYTIAGPIRRSFHILCRPLGLAPGQELIAIVMRETTLLQEMQKMRSEFVSNVSHELRSPLASLIGFIETLQGPAADDPEAQQRFLAIMANEAGRMSRLIDQLLTLSRVEVNESLPPAEEVDMLPLLRQLIGALDLRAGEQGTELTLTVESENTRVLGDSDELSQVFNNLLENAIKYGGANRNVHVLVQEVARIPHSGGKGLAIQVRDEGEGIPPEHQARLTERFYRVDKGRAREVGGTGLGLAIAKHIINRHRGRLAIRSQPGEGSSFTVYLPQVT